jgi:hypothetical protein
MVNLEGPGMKTALALTAAAVALAAAVVPAAAQSSFSVGVSVGNGGYYGPYGRSSYGYPYRPGRAWRSWDRDPWRSGYAYPYYAPAPVYTAPPVVTYETRRRYDPMPRWREVAPRAGYNDYDDYDDYYDDRRRYDSYERYRGEPADRTYDYEPYEPYRGQPVDQGNYATAGEAPPVTPDGMVRYDLSQRGYVASDFEPAARYDQYQSGGAGAAESYIRTPSQTPDELLLGGPR